MRICKVKGCDNIHHAKGYCKKHYCQIWKYGKIFGRTVFDKNEIIVKGVTAEVVLCDVKHGEVGRAIINKEDVGKIEKYKWYLDNYGYAATRTNNKIIKMHHVIVGIESNMKTHIDHKDGHPLNDCRSNLRLCKLADNLKNRGKTRKNTSGFKGVYQSGKNWCSRITADKKRIWLGTFTEKIDAAIAYNKGAVKYHGRFACLNIL